VAPTIISGWFTGYGCAPELQSVGIDAAGPGIWPLFIVVIMRKISLLLSCVLLAIPISLHANTVVEEIVARVNNQIITRTEYQRSKEQTRQEAMRQEPDHADKAYAEREKDVLRGLIDQQLLLERGKDLEINVDTDVIKRLDEMRKQMGLSSMEELEEEARKQGISFEEFKQNMKNQLITQRVIGQEVGSHVNMTKEDETKFYEAHKSEMARPEEIRLSEILVPTKSDDPQAISAAQATAEGLLADIRKGSSFEEVAKKSSEGPTAKRGGDLGYFERGKLAKQLEDTTFAMKPGDVSEPIRTKQGFVLLKVTEHHEAGIPPFNEVEPKIQDALYSERIEPALRAYLTHLREDAFIDVRPGYVDTGASPNETKPMETASKEAGAKNLKKKKKFLLF
jgi:peptidyl-prolyl cis-trans isomerase SurA